MPYPTFKLTGSPCTQCVYSPTTTPDQGPPMIAFNVSTGAGTQSMIDPQITPCPQQCPKSCCGNGGGDGDNGGLGGGPGDGIPRVLTN